MNESNLIRLSSFNIQQKLINLLHKRIFSDFFLEKRIRLIFSEQLTIKGANLNLEAELEAKHKTKI